MKNYHEKKNQPTKDERAQMQRSEFTNSESFKKELLIEDSQKLFYDSVEELKVLMDDIQECEDELFGINQMYSRYNSDEEDLDYEEMMVYEKIAEIEKKIFNLWSNCKTMAPKSGISNQKLAQVMDGLFKRFNYGRAQESHWEHIINLLPNDVNNAKLAFEEIIDKIRLQLDNLTDEIKVDNKIGELWKEAESLAKKAGVSDEELTKNVRDFNYRLYDECFSNNEEHSITDESVTIDNLFKKNNISEAMYSERKKGYESFLKDANEANYPMEMIQCLYNAYKEQDDVKIVLRADLQANKNGDMSIWTEAVTSKDYQGGSYDGREGNYEINKGEIYTFGEWQVLIVQNEFSHHSRISSCESCDKSVKIYTKRIDQVDEYKANYLIDQNQKLQELLDNLDTSLPFKEQAEMLGWKIGKRSHENMGWWIRYGYSTHPHPSLEKVVTPLASYQLTYSSIPTKTDWNQHYKKLVEMVQELIKKS